MLLSVCIAISLTHILFVIGAICFPSPNAGPHTANGWGDPVRFRHLYAARQGLHLHIGEDGRVYGSAAQSSYSLLEIRPVDIGFVAIKGVTSSKYLCMGGTGDVYGSATYVSEDCSFLERILPDGYSVYISRKHHTALSLGVTRPAAQFLPMVSMLSTTPSKAHLPDPPPFPMQGAQPALEPDSMDPFGKLSQIYMQSPSFSER
ncbi:hypothetical protein GJAV_G00235850 [Gymnothorax javanicus]|nr:hypothetical protein GJAV_G00235850 [Gymnothorax javanicus]